MPVYRYLRRFRAFLFGLAGSCDLCTTTLYSRLDIRVKFPAWTSLRFQRAVHIQADSPSPFYPA